MPGAIPHLIAGCAMFLIGRYYFKNYFDGENKFKEKLLLAVVCLTFSFIPDLFLIIYYSTYILPKETFLPYHETFGLISAPIAIAALIILKYWVNTKREPVWIMGLWCILLHITMDLIAPEEISMWI